MDSLRRKDRGISPEETMTLLEQGEFGVLSTVSPEGLPYGVPVNYCLVDGVIYFHCAPTGRKLAHLLASPTVSFCVIGKTTLLPAEFATLYESAIVGGEAAEAFGQEKLAALEGLVRKYSPAFLEQGLRYIEAMEAKTRVFGIRIRQISGKARRQ